MEDRAKCFHVSASILRSSRKDILTDRKRERERESKKRCYISQFFKDAYSAV